MTLELQAPPVVVEEKPLRSATTAKLTVARNEAIKMIKAQLEKGLEIKRAKIRFVPELEKAREGKQEWTQATMTLLKQVFNTDAVADECQNWLGKVLPEYADLNLFIEHFYDEMDQRLRKLNMVLKQVQALPDDSPKSAVMPVAPAPATDATPVVIAAATQTPLPQPTHGVASYPSHKPRGGILIVQDPDRRAQETVGEFITKLGFELSVIVPDPDPKATLLEQLDKQEKLDFGLILCRPDAPPKPFDLGYCVGRLGLKRVYVLTPDGDRVFCDEHGLLHIPLDPADGWQLHVARQLKRAGLEVDLNRVF